MRENRTYGLTRGLEREIALFPALLYCLCGAKKKNYHKGVMFEK